MALHVSKTGRGPAVVLLHGFCETHQVWTVFSPLLADDFTVYAIDMPGFGHRPALSGGFSLAAVAGDVGRWLQEMPVPPRAIIGHSLGGYVALELLAQSPHLADAFGLFHSTYLADAPERKEGRTKAMEFVAKQGVAPFVRNLIPTLFHQKDHPAIPRVLEMALATRAETVIEYTRAMRDRPTHETTAATWRDKLFLIHGESDAVISEQTARKMEAGLPAGHTLHLAETGHMGMYESPSRAAAFIKTLLAR
ncbi:MAG: alpha/beta hydrolase [Cyclobacteriaceae bacterium]|nr:alpha/beta hydrolase [Cyclobacteriaceae bacterium]